MSIVVWLPGGEGKVMEPSLMVSSPLEKPVESRERLEIKATVS